MSWSPSSSYLPPQPLTPKPAARRCFPEPQTIGPVPRSQMSPNGSTMTVANGARSRAAAAASSWAATSHTCSPLPPAWTAAANAATSRSAAFRSASHSSGSLGKPIHTASCGAHSGGGGGVIRSAYQSATKRATSKGRPICQRRWVGSARVEFDDEVGLHPHRIGHLIELRDAGVGDLGGAFRNDVIGHVTLGQALCLDGQRHLLRLGAELDDVADVHPARGDVALHPVDADVAVADQLASGPDGRRELGAIDDHVEPPLEQPDQILRGVALHPRRQLIGLRELLLGDVAVIALELLLGAQLDSEIADLALAALAVLAWSIFAAVDRALGASEDVLAHPAVELVLGGTT